jgi:hypothetical protein
MRRDIRRLLGIGGRRDDIEERTGSHEPRSI